MRSSFIDYESPLPSPPGAKPRPKPKPRPGPVPKPVTTQVVGEEEGQFVLPDAGEDGLE